MQTSDAFKRRLLTVDGWLRSLLDRFGDVRIFAYEIGEASTLANGHIL